MADYGLAAQVGAGGGQNAFNPLGMAAQYQTLNNAMLQNQQAQQQMQQQNALRNILTQSGGKATPDVIRNLIASGNYEPALALQRHQASMGSIGVQTQAAQTALEKARLELGESKRDIAAKTALTDYLSKTPDIADSTALDALRKSNPTAWTAVRKHIEDMREATAKADKEGRAAAIQMFDLGKKSLNFIEPLLPTITDQNSYTGVRNYALSMNKGLANVIGPEYTPENMLRLKNITQSTSNIETKELPNGQIIAINKATGTFSFLRPDGTMTPGGKLADLEGGATPAAPVAAAPPVAPVPGMAPGITASMNATNAMPQVAAPAQAPANAMVQPPVDSLMAIKAQSKQQAITEEEQKAIAREQAQANVKRAETEKTRAEGQTKVAQTLAKLAEVYDRLNEVGGMTSEAKGAKENIPAYLGGTFVGQEVGKALGTKAQSQRNEIMSLVRTLITDIKNATGMSAQELNSNVELQQMLAAVSSPTQSVESVREILQNLSQRYGLGQAIELKSVKPPEARAESGIPQGRASRAAAPNIPPAAINRLKANPSEAAQFDAIFGQGSAASILGR